MPIAFDVGAYGGGGAGAAVAEPAAAEVEVAPLVSPSQNRDAEDGYDRSDHSGDRGVASGARTHVSELLGREAAG